MPRSQTLVCDHLMEAIKQCIVYDGAKGCFSGFNTNLIPFEVKPRQFSVIFYFLIVLFDFRAVRARFSESTTAYRALLSLVKSEYKALITRSVVPIYKNTCASYFQLFFSS